MTITTERESGVSRRRRAGSGEVGRYFAARVGQLLIVLLGVSFMTFVLLNLLPGDPAIAVLGEEAAPEAIESFRARHDLDRPVLGRYVSWLQAALVGDLGTSYTGDRDVLETILNRAPISIELMVLAQAIALAVSIPAALVATWRRGSLVDRLLNMGAFAGLSVPNFLIAYLLIIVFAVNLDWFPATGFTRLTSDPVENLRSAVLPSLTLALPVTAVYLRLLRNDMAETLGHDFVTTAYGKGLATRRVLVRHVFRGSLLSLVTMAGVSVGTMIGGSVITESIFAIPGVGRLLLDGIEQRDLMLVQGIVLFIATAYVLINLAVDMFYTALDPRIRA